MSSFLLNPIMPSPELKLYQRLAALEARLAAVERKRDIVFTPIATNGTFQWHGGRVWIIAIGNVTSGGSGSLQVILASNGTNFASASAVPTAAGQKFPLVFQAAAFNPATYFWAPGADVNVGASQTGTGAGGSLSVDMLVIEWPQA
jgi:hypothetical protein